MDFLNHWRRGESKRFTPQSWSDEDKKSHSSSSPINTHNPTLIRRNTTNAGPKCRLSGMNKRLYFTGRQEEHRKQTHHGTTRTNHKWTNKRQWVVQSDTGETHEVIKQAGEHRKTRQELQSKSGTQDTNLTDTEQNNTGTKENKSPKSKARIQNNKKRSHWVAASSGHERFTFWELNVTG